MTLEEIMIALEDSDLPDPVYLAVERLLRAGQVMRDKIMSDDYTGRLYVAKAWDAAAGSDK